MGGPLFEGEYIKERGAATSAKEFPYGCLAEQRLQEGDEGGSQREEERSGPNPKRDMLV